MNKAAFSKLIEAMRSLSNEVNDQEICRRLETLMLTSKDDLNLSIVNHLLDNPMEFDPKEIPEPYTMYVKHFIYMVKRNEKLGISSRFQSVSETKASKKKKFKIAIVVEYNPLLFYNLWHDRRIYQQFLTSDSFYLHS